MFNKNYVTFDAMHQELALQLQEKELKNFVLIQPEVRIFALIFIDPSNYYRSNKRPLCFISLRWFV
jgi:hypothetical protein